LSEQKQHTSPDKLITFFRKHSYSLFIFSSFLVISFIIIYQVNKEKKIIVAVEKNETPLMKLYRNLDFAGEKFPVDDSNCVALLDREIKKNIDHTMPFKTLINRSLGWFSVIEPILKKNNIPEDFKYLPIIESQFTNVVSPRGATGFWQFVAGTASHCGLEINDQIDERYHVEKATEAACKYFKEAYAQFNNWTLVAASYNLGMGGINEQLKKQNVNSYYNLKLNEETKRYLFRLLAVKAMVNHSDFFGLEFKRSSIPDSYKKIKVDSSIQDLNQFAEQIGTKLIVLKHVNPWIKGNKLDNTCKKPYFISVPPANISQQILEQFTKDSIKKDNLDSL